MLSLLWILYGIGVGVVGILGLFSWEPFPWAINVLLALAWPAVVIVVGIAWYVDYRKERAYLEECRLKIEADKKARTRAERARAKASCSGPVEG